MGKVRRAVILVLAALALSAAPARAGGPAMIVGAVDDVIKQDTLVAAKAKLDLLRLAGFRAVRVTSIWAPGLRAPTAADQRQLANVAGAARLAGLRVFVSVYNFGSRTTPLTEQDQSNFAQYAATIARRNSSILDFIVGNEPNLNRFWLPQFNPDGSDAAAPAYESLLARTYDALKTVDPQIQVIGGAVSPRGIDRPGTGRDTHSPTAFIADLGAAYRASGRTLPIMDALAIHVYEDNSSLPPSFAHPNTTTIAVADYEKLVALLGQAFDGTAQPGSTLPIVYGEFGVETQIPAERASLYAGSELATTKPVDEATQASYYRDAIALSFCQPNVRAILVLHAVDETDMRAWQSGVYYADGTPKSSLPAVKQSIRDADGGVIARCEGLQLTPQGTAAFPRGPALASIPLTIRLACDIDCNYYARLERVPRGSTTLAVYGRAPAGTQTAVTFPARRVARGRYRFTLRLTAPVNVGPPLRLASDPVTIA